MGFRPVREGAGSRGMRTHPLAGQIISNSCSFSPETEFTHQNFLKIRTPLCKNPEIRTHTLPPCQKSAYGPGYLKRILLRELVELCGCNAESVETFRRWFVCLCWGLTSQSTIFQSCRDGATASWVINQYFRGVKCLAQGHNTAAVGFEPPTSRSGVRHSTTEPPRCPFRRWMKSWKRTPCPADLTLWFDVFFSRLKNYL